MKTIGSLERDAGGCLFGLGGVFGGIICPSEAEEDVVNVFFTVFGTF